MSSYSHHIQKLNYGGYRLSWVVDFKYSGSRLRFPRTMTRDTEEEGARKFAKKWGCKFPEDQP